MCDEPLRGERLDNLAYEPLVRLAIRGVTRYENVNVTGVRLAPSIRPHDLDKDLIVEGQRLVTNDLKQLSALLPWDTSAEIIIQRNANL